MKTILLKLNFILLTTLFLTGCGDDEPTPEAQLSSVLVVNEGNFQAANGSISTFDLNTSQVTQGVLEVDATAQNVVAYNEHYYLVANAPDKVEVIDKTDLSAMVSITSGFNNPFDFAAIGNRGYVTNWGTLNSETWAWENSYIAIIDLESNEVIDSVALDVQPNGIVALNGQLYIANQGTSYVSVLDPSDLSIDHINTPFGPSNFVVDADQDLWVLCTSGSLVEIDAGTNTVSRKIENIVTSGYNEKLAINGEGNVIYFLGGNNDTFTGSTTVYQVAIDSDELSVASFVTDGFAFYGIAVNPDNGEVYVGDSNAFQSTGTGFVYDAQGNSLSSFATGIGPNNFIFQ